MSKRFVRISETVNADGSREESFFVMGEPSIEKNFGLATPAGEDDPFGGHPLEFGPRDVAEAKHQSEAAQIILTNMFYATFDEDRVWTNDEWRAAIGKAANRYPAFTAILADERTDWRNDDFADRVIAIRDR